MFLQVKTASVFRASRYIYFHFKTATFEVARDQGYYLLVPMHAWLVCTSPLSTSITYGRHLMHSPDQPACKC